MHTQGNVGLWFDYAYKWIGNYFCENGGQGSKILKTQLSSFTLKIQKSTATKWMKLILTW